jgi:hypothetical protein
MLDRALEQLKTWFSRRRHNYQGCFESDFGHYVLADLWRICHAGRTTYTGDRDASLIAEGRRQVYLHILSQVRMSEDDVHLLALQQTREQQGHLK